MTRISLWPSTGFVARATRRCHMWNRNCLSFCLFFFVWPLYVLSLAIVCSFLGHYMFCPWPLYVLSLAIVCSVLGHCMFCCFGHCMFCCFGHCMFYLTSITTYDYPFGVFKLFLQTMNYERDRTSWRYQRVSRQLKKEISRQSKKDKPSIEEG